MGYGDYPDLRNVQKILVVKLRHLGDVLLASPVFRSLKRAFPQAAIDAYVYQEAVPMLEGHPCIHRLIGYDRRKNGRIRREIALLWELRKQGYDVAVNLTEGDRGVLAARASGASVRVGVRPKGRWQRGALTHISKEGSSLRHAVEKNLDVLRRIGIFPEIEDRELDFFIPAEARHKVLEWTGGKPFIMIHPASRWRFKCWPSARMRQLAERLIMQGNRVVLTSGPDEAEVSMTRAIGQGLEVCNLAGALSLKELGALIDASDLLVSVDSVPLHLASALKKPVVALFGPTSEIAWGPWRNPDARIVTQQYSCRPCYRDGCGGSKKSDCLETLPLEAVLDAIASLRREAQGFSQPEIFPEISPAGIGMGDEFADRAREQNLSALN